MRPGGVRQHIKHLDEKDVELPRNKLAAYYLAQPDISALTDLQAKCRQENPAALIPRTFAQYTRGMQAGHSHIGIYDGDKLIAHIRINPDNADAADSTAEAALSAVMVVPDWRGYKLTHILVALGIEEAAYTGYKQLNARVLPANKAMWQTFERHGFVYQRLAKSRERPAEPDCEVYHYARRLANTALPGN